MRHFPAAWWPIALVVFLAGLTTWLNQFGGEPRLLDDSGFEHEPDYIVEHFAATAFDPQGHPRYRLAAANMIHYMDDDTTSLAAPRFELSVPGSPRMQAVARRGVVSSNGEHVHLLEQVIITRAAAGMAPAAVMTTEYLHITPELEQLRSHKDVLLRQGASQIRARGLFADGKRLTLELHGQVRGVYERPS